MDACLSSATTPCCEGDPTVWRRAMSTCLPHGLSSALLVMSAILMSLFPIDSTLGAEHHSSHEPPSTAPRILIVGDAVTTGVASGTTMPGLASGAASYRHSLQQHIQRSVPPSMAPVFVGPSEDAYPAGLPPRHSEFLLGLGYAGGWTMTAREALSAKTVVDAVAGLDPDIVILQIGGNDLGRAAVNALLAERNSKTPPPETPQLSSAAAHVSRVIVALAEHTAAALSRQTGSRRCKAVLVTALVPVDPRHAHDVHIEEVNALLRDAFPLAGSPATVKETCATPSTPGIFFVDWARGFDADAHLLLPQGIVPNPEGELILGKSLAKSLAMTLRGGVGSPTLAARGAEPRGADTEFFAVFRGGMAYGIGVLVAVLTGLLSYLYTSWSSSHTVARRPSLNGRAGLTRIVDREGAQALLAQRRGAANLLRLRKASATSAAQPDTLE